MPIQAVLFKRPSFTKDKAIKWLKKHNMKHKSTKLVKITEKFLHYEMKKSNKKKYTVL